MDYWARTGRPVLLAALEAVCDTIGEELGRDIQQRDDDRASLVEEISQLKAVTARVDELEKENHALVQELDQLRSKIVSRDVKSPESLSVISSISSENPGSTSRPALAEISVNSKIGAVSAGTSEPGPEKTRNWEKEYTKLALKHRALKQQHEETHGAAKRLRESRDSWTKYALSLEGKIERLKKLPRHENANDRVSTPGDDRLLPSETGSVYARSNQAVRGSSAVLSAKTASSPSPHEDGVEGTTVRETTTPTSKATGPGRGEPSAEEETQDKTDGVDELPPLLPSVGSPMLVTIKQEPSSDIPVIVSERAVRKRKHADDDAGMPAPPRKIKSEQSSSSEPVITAEIPTFRPHESMDLDEEERGMPTPRKQRPLEHQPIYGHVAASLEDPPSDPRPAGTPPVKKRAISPSRGVDARSGLAAASGLSPHKASKTRRDRLSPIRAGWTMAGGIADVAEETVESFYSPAPRQAAKDQDQTPAQGRLQSLLNYGSPKKGADFLPPVRPGRDTPTRHLNQGDAENMLPGSEIRHRHDDPIKTFSMIKASPATALRKHAQDKGTPAKPSRLRDRPLADLRPEDFRVNPKFNNGYRHAFDEVVRNRDERAELAGCTDPNCCGRQFRAMAESELSAGGPGVLSRMADVKMMENYLGNEAYRLFDMTREERRETWLKAKIQDLADRYGRHRHRFARRPSPPGYWNPDFPSTQEIEKSKEEAEKLERGLVEERWREAMRGDGRWLFRDE